MKPLTIFSFGYYGWGNSTPQLIQAVDAIEGSRGYQPPLFVEVRHHRSGRAPGFVGAAFEDLLGADRYRWKKSLGNKMVDTQTPSKIQIAEPKTVAELLDLALEAAKHKQRVIFFCGCQWPRVNEKVACHRTRVSTLVLAAARRRGVPTEIVEWPGGRPGRISLVGRTDQT